MKPDLSPEERLREATFLKERWNLIQSGTERKLIKIRNNSILVSGKVYGRLVGSAFQLSSSSDQALIATLPSNRLLSPDSNYDGIEDAMRSSVEHSD